MDTFFVKVLYRKVRSYTIRIIIVTIIIMVAAQVYKVHTLLNFIFISKNNLPKLESDSWNTDMSGCKHKYSDSTAQALNQYTKKITELFRVVFLNVSVFNTLFNHWPMFFCCLKA